MPPLYFSTLNTRIMEIKKIEELLERVNELTDDEKSEIREAVKEAGLKMNFRTNCKNCYSDALMLLRHHAKGDEVKKSARESITDAKFDDLVLVKRKGAPVMRAYTKGGWLEVDENKKSGIAHLRMLWEGGHQRTVMLFYNVSKKAADKAETETENGKEVSDGGNS